MNWLKDPEAVLPDTDMSKPEWKSEKDMVNVVSYLKSFRIDVVINTQDKYQAVEAGEILVKEYDCRACHILKGEEGLERYPDLTHIGSKTDTGTLDKRMKEHQVSKKGSFIPEYRTMTDEDRKAVVSYLETLK